MSKFLHDDAGPGAGDSAKRVGVRWPSLPWTCPRCKETRFSHKETIATVPTPWGPEEVKRATFLCVMCDFLLHGGSADA